MEEQCEQCEGRGWIMMHQGDDEPAIVIERCDYCERFDDDNQAAQHVLAQANAAPDLLGALEKIRDLDADCREEEAPIMPQWYRDRIDAAIAKARGEDGNWID